MNWKSPFVIRSTNTWILALSIAANLLWSFFALIIAFSLLHSGKADIGLVQVGLLLAEFLGAFGIGWYCGWLAFDDRNLYVALELEDPDPRAIREPLTDRDNAIISSDYAGIVIDGLDAGKTAQEFLANPRGVQYDAIWSDIAGESLAPNFHYESAARIHERGWTLEMKIPFASVRYAPGPAPEWGVTLIRNWPRERRYEFSTAVQPTSCFICNQNRLVGLEDLPAGGSWVLAPYV